MRRSKKGVALPLETVVLLILAAVVLGALLAFFLGIFTPTQIETDLQRKQISICQEVFSKDPLCKNTDALTAGDKLRSEGVCKTDRPGCNGNDAAACIKTCCGVFCPAG